MGARLENGLGLVDPQLVRPDQLHGSLLWGDGCHAGFSGSPRGSSPGWHPPVKPRNWSSFAGRSSLTKYFEEIVLAGESSQTPSLPRGSGSRGRSGVAGPSAHRQYARLAETPAPAACQLRGLERIHKFVPGRIHLRADNDGEVMFCGQRHDIIQVLQLPIPDAGGVIPVRNDVDAQPRRRTWRPRTTPRCLCSPSEVPSSHVNVGIAPDSRTNRFISDISGKEPWSGCT